MTERQFNVRKAITREAALLLGFLFLGLVLLPIAIYVVGQAIFGDYGGGSFGHFYSELSSRMLQARFMSTARSAPGVRLYSYQRGCFGNWNRTVYITMVKRLINWLKGNAAADIGQPAKRRRVSAHAALHARVTPPPPPRKQAEFLELGSGFEGRIENAGPSSCSTTGRSIRVSPSASIPTIQANSTVPGTGIRASATDP